jgi:glycosyltransferase involved in cell wall biosynthesis
LKIIFVNRFYAPDHSATSQMLTDLATALAAGGMDVHVVTSRLQYDDAAAALAPFERIDGVSVRRVRTSTFGRATLPGRTLDYLSFYFAASFALFRLALAGDIVVAKTDPPLISVPVGWIARWRRAHHVNWLQDLFPEVAAELGVGLGRGAGGSLLRWLRDRSLNTATRNVVLSHPMRDRLVARGIDPQSITTIPNWADGAALQPVPPAANPLRPAWGLEGKFVVCYSGNMGRAHEFQTIVDAAVALREQRDILFLFIGGGAQQDLLAQAAAQHVNVLCKPYQPREGLAQSLSVADVHLVSLRPQLEGLIVPSKFFGIAAVGRPTIFVGDPDGEIAQVIRKEECGLTMREGNAAGLAAAIRSLRNDTRLCEQMGLNARRVFETCYDKPLAVAKWRRLLQDVARQPVR